MNAGRLQGKAVVAKLAGCNDRDAAEALLVPRSRSRAPSCHESRGRANSTGPIWSVCGQNARRCRAGKDRPAVRDRFERRDGGAGDRERLVPYIWQQVVREVDLEAGVMVVDWDPDF